MEQQNKTKQVKTSSTYRYKECTFWAFKSLETVQPLNTIIQTTKSVNTASLRHSRDITAPKCNSMVI